MRVWREEEKEGVSEKLILKLDQSKWQVVSQLTARSLHVSTGNRVYAVFSDSSKSHCPCCVLTTNFAREVLHLQNYRLIFHASTTTKFGTSEGLTLTPQMHFVPKYIWMQQYIFWCIQMHSIVHCYISVRAFLDVFGRIQIQMQSGASKCIQVHWELDGERNKATRLPICKKSHPPHIPSGIKERVDFNEGISNRSYHLSWKMILDTYIQILMKTVNWKLQ